MPRSRGQSRSVKSGNKPHRIAVYAGSFDPVTLGHMYLIEEGVRLFDQLVVAIGVNPAKSYTFTLDDRIAMLKKCTRGLDNIRIERLDNRFLVEYAHSMGAAYVLRGIRNVHDYEYERTMRQINSDQNPNVTTVFLLPPRALAELSSSFVKGLVGPRGWERVVKEYLPAPVYKMLLNRCKK